MSFQREKRSIHDIPEELWLSHILPNLASLRDYFHWQRSSRWCYQMTCVRGVMERCLVAWDQRNAALTSAFHDRTAHQREMTRIGTPHNLECCLKRRLRHAAALVKADAHVDMERRAGLDMMQALFQAASVASTASRRTAAFMAFEKRHHLVLWASCYELLPVLEVLLQVTRGMPDFVIDPDTLPLAAASGRVHVVEMLLADGRADPASPCHRWVDVDGSRMTFDSKMLSFPHEHIRQVAIDVACRNMDLDMVRILLKDRRVDPTANHYQAVRSAVSWPCPPTPDRVGMNTARFRDASDPPEIIRHLLAHASSDREMLCVALNEAMQCDAINCLPILLNDGRLRRMDLVEIVDRLVQNGAHGHYRFLMGVWRFDHSLFDLSLQPHATLMAQVALHSNNADLLTRICQHSPNAPLTNPFMGYHGYEVSIEILNVLLEDGRFTPTLPYLRHVCSKGRRDLVQRLLLDRRIKPSIAWWRDTIQGAMLGKDMLVFLSKHPLNPFNV